MTKRAIAAVLLIPAVSACSTIGQTTAPTLGERNSGYNYVAIDPLPVKGSYTHCRSRRGEGKDPDWMDALPDNAVRIAINDASGKAGATLGPVTVGASGGRYRVVLDYGNVDTANIRFALPEGTLKDLRERVESKQDIGAFEIARIDGATAGPQGTEEVVVPVYVGVGLRLTAFVAVKKGGINLASLGAIAAAAEANEVAGTLTVQTLGVAGSQVASSLPLPSELNPTTVQNAIQSLGAIKAIIYDKDTLITPRVTGIYNPFPSSDPKVINAVVSQLAARPIEWQTCINK